MRIASALAIFVFWSSLVVVVYTYFVYPVILLLLFALAQLRADLRYLFNRSNRRVARIDETEVPSVTFVIPAHNEEIHLPEKLNNIQALDYPREKLQVIIVSDGSTDGTNEILGKIREPYVQTIIVPQRAGKASALNCATARARNDILVFSDASTLFEPGTVKNLARHFRDPLVGAVCGSLRFQASSESQQTEGVYWKYESALRLMENRLGATLTASGAVYALRRNAYSPLRPNTVLDDFVVPMNARRIGYRVLYDPEAIATDFAPDTIAGEFARRVRIAAGSFQALPSLMRVPLRGVTGFCFFSHKLLRWTVPFVLIAIFISNAMLLQRPFYLACAGLQIALYSWALLGLAFHKHVKQLRYALVCYFLLAMNAAFLVGFFKYLQNREAIDWRRVS